MDKAAQHSLGCRSLEPGVTEKALTTIVCGTDPDPGRSIAPIHTVRNAQISN
jgi:hypothetical protein